MLVIQRKLISSNMKSQNPFCCCLVSHISSFIGFSEVYGAGGETEFSNIRKETVYKKKQFRGEIVKRL